MCGLPVSWQLEVYWKKVARITANAFKLFILGSRDPLAVCQWHWQGTGNAMTITASGSLVSVLAAAAPLAP